MSSIEKVLNEILDNKTFDRLDPLIENRAWDTFSDEQKALLAHLLMMRGHAQMEEELNERALDSFEIARSLTQNHPEMLYQQALILKDYRDQLQCLTIASDCLSDALKCSPDFCKGWLLLAHVLVDIALLENDCLPLEKACRCFEKGCDLFPKEGFSHIQLPVLYWRWGFCLASLGQFSGEPIDFYRAVEKYQQALSGGIQEGAFFKNFGDCLAHLGAMLDKDEYFIQALDMFERATELEPDDFEAWFGRGCCILNISNSKSNEEMLAETIESFQRAAQIDSDFAPLWLKWGELEAFLGKVRKNSALIDAGLAKISRAHELDPDNAQILNIFAECELSLGASENRLDLLYSAQEKLAKSLSLQEENPHVWYLYGSCFNEFGAYFDDEVYYQIAIEKFEQGLGFTKNDPLLFYGLSLSHFALGEMLNDIEDYETAAKYCELAAEGDRQGFPQFWSDWGLTLLRIGEIKREPSIVEAAVEKFEKTFHHSCDEIEDANIDIEWIYHYSCAFDLLGELHDEPHYFEKAIQIFNQILQLNPRHVPARYNLALSFVHLADAVSDAELYERALDHFQYLIEQDPENELVHLDYGIALTNLSILAIDQHLAFESDELYRRAESHFMQAAALGCTQAYYQLAGLYSLSGHLTQAMEYLKRCRFSDALPSLEDLLHDEWLTAIRSTADFRAFLQDLPDFPISENDYLPEL